MKQYAVSTLYGGDRLEFLCNKHAKRTESRINDNAEMAYFPYMFKEVRELPNSQCKYCQSQPSEPSGRESPDVKTNVGSKTDGKKGDYDRT